MTYPQDRQPVGYTAGGFPIYADQPPPGSLRHPQQQPGPPYPMLAPPPYLPPPKKSSGMVFVWVALGVAALVVVGFATGVISVFSKSKSSDHAEQRAPMLLQVGDCVEISNVVSGPVGMLPVLPCDQPHNGQVFTMVTLSDDEIPTSPDYTRHALDQCQAAVPGFLGAAHKPLAIFAIAPDERGWRAHIRQARCVLVDRDKDFTGDIRSDR